MFCMINFISALGTYSDEMLSHFIKLVTYLSDLYLHSA